jgi:putative transposase
MVIETETIPDQVNQLFNVDTQLGIHKLVQAVKGRSSRVPGREFAWMVLRLRSSWANPYFVASIGGATISVIRRSVETPNGR